MLVVINQDSLAGLNHATLRSVIPFCDESHLTH